MFSNFLVCRYTWLYPQFRFRRSRFENAGLLNTRFPVNPKRNLAATGSFLDMRDAIANGCCPNSRSSHQTLHPSLAFCVSWNGSQQEEEVVFFPEAWSSYCPFSAVGPAILLYEVVPDIRNNDRKEWGTSCRITKKEGFESREWKSKR